MCVVQLRSHSYSMMKQKSVLQNVNCLHHKESCIILARPDHRPSKKDRRDIGKFKKENDQQFDQQWSYNDD